MNSIFTHQLREIVTQFRISEIYGSYLERSHHQLHNTLIAEYLARM